MTQEVILKNLSKYLEVVSKKYLAELEHDKNEKLAKIPKKNIKEINVINEKYKKERESHSQYINKVKKELITQGFCFGFAVCHAVMDIDGKLNWWEKVLYEIANWDGKELSLEEFTSLPDEHSFKEDPLVSAEKNIKHKEDSLNNKKRKYVFERALNYIVFNQSRDNNAFQEYQLKESTQNAFLLPDDHGIFLSENLEKKQSYFEMLSTSVDEKKEVIKTIKKHIKMAGHFSKENLENLLDEQTMQGCICLVHSITHTIRIGYNGSQWIYYDPNDNHKKIPIHFSGSKQEVIDKIIFDLETQNIAIEVASFDENKKMDFPYYDQLLKKSPASLLKEGGVDIFSSNAPDRLIHLMKQAKSSADKSIYSVLTEGITKKDNDNNNGLYNLEIDSVDALCALFHLAHGDSEEEKSLKQAIAIALKQASSEKTNVLFTIIKYDAEILPELFKLADTSKEGLEIRSAIAYCLTENIKADKNCLFSLAKNEPRYLPQAIELALSVSNKKSRWFHHIIETLALKHSKGVTGWEIIEAEVPKGKDIILNQLLSHIDSLDTDTLMAFNKELHKAVHSDTSPYRGICKKPPSYFFLDKFGLSYGKTEIWNKLTSKTKSVLASRQKEILDQKQDFSFRKLLKNNS